MYIHLYARLGDHAWIVAGPVREFAMRCVEAAIADSWFFVRYARPEPHIRLRLRGQQNKLARDGLEKFRKWAEMLIETRTCSRVSLETYEREIERYGGLGGMEIAEQIFAADSIAAAHLLSPAMRGTFQQDVMQVVVTTADQLLASLGLSPDARADWLDRRASRDPAIGREFRRRKSNLRESLSTPFAASPDISQIIETRDLVIRGAMETLVALQREGNVIVGLDDMRGHFLHMHFNRLLGPNIELERMAIGLAARARRSLVSHGERRSSE